MAVPAFEYKAVNQRVRAILLTEDQHVLFIKRVKPHKPHPYWVAPGGGVEEADLNLTDALQRELSEELGSTAEVLGLAFVLRHQKAGKDLEEYFFVCAFEGYNLTERSGPEFADPTRGQYIPDFIPLEEAAIARLNIRTVELREWLLNNLDYLRTL